MREMKKLDDMTPDELKTEVVRLRAKVEQMWRKSKAHRQGLKDQQKAILERNSRIGNLELTLAHLIPETEKAPVQGYLAEKLDPEYKADETPVVGISPSMFRVT